MRICDKCGKEAAEQIVFHTTKEVIDLCGVCGREAMDYLKSKPGALVIDDEQATGDELKRRRGRKKKSDN